jgi:UDP-N-acetylglucosamine acyltransferase
VRGFNVSKALNIIETEIPVSDERDEIISFVRDTGRGIMKGYIRRHSEDMP